MSAALRLTVTPRERESRGLAALVLAGSLAAGLAAICVVFAASGVDPFYALYRIFAGSFGSVYGLGETVTKAIPLILIGAGLAFVFRAKFWNIGAEGQLLAGATAATWIGLNVHLPGPLLVALMFLAGFAAGAAWGALLALLKARFGVNEVISSLMLNYIAYELITLLITGPWKGPTQHGFPYTDDFSRAASLAVLPGTRIHAVTLVLAERLRAVNAKLAAIASLTSMGGCDPQLRVHIHAALNQGASRQEVIEVILQMTVYAGFPKALNALYTAKDIFEKRDKKDGRD